MDHLAGVGPGGQQRVIAEDLGVAEGGTRLALGATSQMVESTSITRRARPGPTPRLQARSSTRPTTTSSWRTWPKLNARRKVPSVQGAMTRWVGGIFRGWSGFIDPLNRWIEVQGSSHQLSRYRERCSTFSRSPSRPRTSTPTPPSAATPSSKATRFLQPSASQMQATRRVASGSTRTLHGCD